MGGKSALGGQLESFREARRDIEASVLPLATSVDGRRFSFQASLHGLELQAGGYAVLDDGGTRRLGQVLSVERLLTETDLRMVIFDPNSDFTRLGEVRPDADPALAGRYRQAARGVAVYSAGAQGERRLRLHAAEVEPAAQAAALRLDPIADREEYPALAALLAGQDSPTIEELTDSDLPEAARLGLRIKNLGADRYSVWASGESGRP
jgi:hypothetical protein